MNKTKWIELISKAPHAQKLINKNIKYPTKKEQLEAVKQNGYSIRFIHDPDKEIVVHYLLAVCPDLLMDPKCDLKEGQ